MTMQQATLQRMIAQILAEEEQARADWKRVEELSDEVNERLRQEPDTQVPDAIYHFLDDVDIRKKDANYATRQRSLARQYVDTGEMVEHAPSVPWWSCFPTLILSAALLLWWFF
jgi:hypothetical protein